jgi:hypothetical protein
MLSALGDAKGLLLACSGFSCLFSSNTTSASLRRFTTSSMTEVSICPAVLASLIS